MYRRILLLFFLSQLCTVKIFAQLNFTGKMLDFKDGKTDAIYFKRTLNPIDNKTKYSILFNGVEIYEVDFTYHKEQDSILVDFYDKQNPISKRETVSLKSKDSHFLICNYIPNVWPINDTTSKPYQILFGIDQPNQQFITLYQFQAIGGIQTQFILQYVPNDVFEGHHKAVLNKMMMDSLQAKHILSLEHLRSRMISYKDSVINSIEAKEDALKLKRLPQSASIALQTDFEEKMNSIFIGYFKKIYSFRNERFDISLTFNCNGYGHISIDTMQNISFKNEPQKNWLRDSLVRVIKPEIEQEVYNSLPYTYTNPKLKINFSDWFEKSLTANDLGDVDMPFFAKTEKQVINELSAYETRTINVPTAYSYTFNYYATVKEPTWKYVHGDAGADKFIDKSEKEDSIEITESLKQLFLNKFGPVANGKYIVKICTLSIKNGTFEGQDMQIVEKK
jgi:hypothetical protein